MVTRPDELGTGQVWSDLSKPIIHFGSPTQHPPLLDGTGKPLER